MCLPIQLQAATFLWTFPINSIRLIFWASQQSTQMMVCFLDKIHQAEVSHHSALLWVLMTCQGQQLLYLFLNIFVQLLYSQILFNLMGNALCHHWSFDKVFVIYSIFCCCPRIFDRTSPVTIQIISSTFITCVSSIPQCCIRVVWLSLSLQWEFIVVYLHYLLVAS